MAAVTSSVTSVVRYRATTRTGGGLLGAPLAPNRARPSRCAHDEQHAATGRYGVPGRAHGCWRRDQAEGQCPGQVLFPQVDGGLSGCHAPGPTFGWQAEPRQQDASPRQTRTGVTASPLLRSPCPAQPQVTAVLATLPGPWAEGRPRWLAAPANLVHFCRRVDTLALLDPGRNPCATTSTRLVT